ncbi:hypothetical protein [Mycolicibacterium setense]|uniref:hypothetical protein n=1 Tax=Mycolicibacterium setense TaxID=431269 RepID=UPI0027E26E01|nr:hypothetical protein [Mycolicibacterium setense]
MKAVERELVSNRFNSIDQFVEASRKGARLYEAIEVLLKAPEISLSKHRQPSYLDKMATTGAVPVALVE